MKRIFLSIALICSISLGLSAQTLDSRQRSVDTIVSDVLAALPSQNNADFKSGMNDLASSSPESVVLLASMLAPASNGVNAKVEYALSGLAVYASAEKDLKDAVTEGFAQAISNQADSVNRAFLQAQLRLLGKAPESGFIAVPQISSSMSASNVLKAMRSTDRKLRVQALNAAPEDAAFRAKLVKAKCAPGAEADILYWLGEHSAAAQMPYILKAVDGPYSEDAQAAAAKIGGHDAAVKLCSILSPSLDYFNGDFSKELMDAAAVADKETLRKILQIASRRHITAFRALAFENAAYSSLEGLVTAEDEPALASLLDKASAADAEMLSRAYTKSVSYSSDIYSDVMGRIAHASNPERFYHAIAESGTDDAANFLDVKYERGSEEALAALSIINNVNAVPALLRAASSDENYILRAVKLLSSSNKNAFFLCDKYTKALGLARSPKIKTAVLRAMASVALPAALRECSKFLDDPDVANEAALACKTIMASCHASVDYSELQSIASKAIKVLQVSGGADDGYAVSEIETILEKHKVYPVSSLTEEEKALGFEMLYDGTDLDKWIGDKNGYTSVNGVINVTASYGLESGNLYTAKEYRNFIYRFEFVFLEPAVNNGVGIRTPMNVDAAYHGMCECQILDHDDPVYANLHEYQVHGSAYGIIPAKRLKHKPVGEWSSEEIEVRGNHIKVTVNGEVIVDGDLSEACQGHNVAPDGSNVNPYTVDHKNHPGMFNARGYISFCGHGNGLQFRNIRILDLGDKD